MQTIRCTEHATEYADVFADYNNATIGFHFLAKAFANCFDHCLFAHWASPFRFAQSRFCGAEGLSNVTTLSTLRGADFKQAYGVAITEGPLAGLTARAVVVVDANDKVVYSQLVPEIKEEPDYAAALAALK